MIKFKNSFRKSKKAQKPESQDTALKRNEEQKQDRVKERVSRKDRQNRK